MAQVRNEFPALKITEITKLISERYAKLEAPAKQEFTEKAEALKEAYKTEMDKYVAAYGKPEPVKRKVAKGKGAKPGKERKPRKKKVES